VNLPEQGGDGNDEADGGNRDRQPGRDCHIRMIEQAAYERECLVRSGVGAGRI
jgi:hypothetical protein